jgi:hypothetical protein
MTTWSKDSTSRCRGVGGSLCILYILCHSDSHGPHDTVVFWAGTTGTGVSQITKVGSEGRTGFCYAEVFYNRSLRRIILNTKLPRFFFHRMTWSKYIISLLYAVGGG